MLGIFCQFVLLPFLGFVIVNAMQLDANLGITLLVVTSSPGGSYSNWYVVGSKHNRESKSSFSLCSTSSKTFVFFFLSDDKNRWCSLFNADLALSVTMTAISTVLSCIALPVNLLVYANISYNADVISDLDWTSVFVALAIVISAIALGLYMSHKSHSYKFNMLANKVGNIAGFLLIVFSATVTNVGDAESRIWNRHWTFYVATVAPCILGLIVASALASLISLRKPERM